MASQWATLTAGFAVCLAGAACSGPDERSSEPTSEESPAGQRFPEADPQRPAVDATVVHRMSEFDYEMLSLVELVEDQPVVVVGEVVGWSNGRTGVDSGDGYRYTDLYGVVEIEVTKSYRMSEGYESDHLFVEVPRGGEEHDAGERDDTEPVLSTIEELNRAVPTGTRVMFAGGKAPTKASWERQAPGTTVENTTNRSVRVENLLWPHIQGLIFEDDNGDFVSGLTDDEDQWNWVPDTESAGNGFDYLVDELDKLTK